jgi:hypothetical protein
MDLHMNYTSHQMRLLDTPCYTPPPESMIPPAPSLQIPPTAPSNQWATRRSFGPCCRQQWARPLPRVVTAGGVCVCGVRCVICMRCLWLLLCSHNHERTLSLATETEVDRVCTVRVTVPPTARCRAWAGVGGAAWLRLGGRHVPGRDRVRRRWMDGWWSSVQGSILSRNRLESSNSVNWSQIYTGLCTKWSVGGLTFLLRRRSAGVMDGRSTSLFAQLTTTHPIV